MYGALEGQVSDSARGLIPGAALRLREVSTHQVRDSSTDAEGAFRFSQLPPGTYEVEVRHPGFEPYRHAGVTVQVGATTHLTAVLQSAGVTTQVTVTDQPPAIDPAQTSITHAVDTESIEELPVESRNYLNFALLAPGVAPSAQQAGRHSMAALPDSGFSFGGLRGRSNSVLIDGLDNNDEYVGASRTELSLETVREFQVVNGGLSAESGGASGGSINVVTRVGGNDLHGDAFLFLENGALNARNPFEAETATSSLHRDRLGLALGGPVVKDRTFYYLGFEQERSRSREDSFLSGPVISAVNSVLASGMYPDLATRRITDNPFPVARAETEASAKVNHQISAANWLMLRYAFTGNREAGDAFHASGLDDSSSRGSSFTADHALSGALTTVFSPQSVGDLRFQIASRGVVLRTNDMVGPGVEIEGLVNFGRPYDGNGSRTETHQELTYTYSRSAGRHLWKAGVTAHRIHLDANSADGFGGLYIFGSLADFAAGRPDSFRQSFGSIGTDFAVQNLGGFIQDHWTLAPHLTLDLGLRYDFEHLPGLFHQDSNNVSPRAGLAWQPASGWVVRTGYGIFFDRYVLSALNRVLQKNGPAGGDRITNDSLTGILTYGADPHLATPYSQQASFSVEHLLARDLTVAASYLHVRGVKLPRTRPAGNRDLLEDSASSTYDGVTLSLNRRLADEFEFSASYTLSKAYDDASDFNEQPQDPANLRAERAVSLQHQQQRLVFSALWELPIGDEEPGQKKPDDIWSKIFGHLEVAPIFTAGSGRPVNPLTGVDTYRTFAFPLSARPPGIGRNAYRTPSLANLDFRLLRFIPMGKTSKLDLVADAFNLWNHANVTQVNPIYGQGAIPVPGFLQPVAGDGARRIQFSIDFEF